MPMPQRKSVPRLALKTINGEWSLTLYRALWLGWGAPILTAGLGYEYGVLGAVVGVVLIVITIKGSNQNEKT